MRWVLTVFSLIASSRAISLFGRPRATSASTSRSRSERSSSGEPAARSLEQRPACARIERRLASRGGAHRLSELRGLGVLEQVADRARVERAKDLLAVGERGEDDDGDVGLRGGDPPGRLDPVEHRHLEVHQHDVGLVLRAQADGLLAVRRGADELDVVERRRPGAGGPVRTTAWSSAMRSRIIGVAAPARTSCRRRASSVPRPPRPTVPRAPRAARGRRGPRSRLRSRSLGREAGAVVANVESYRVVLRSERDRDARRRRRGARRSGAPPRPRGRRGARRPRVSLGSALDLEVGRRALVPRAGRGGRSSAASSPLARRFGGWISTSSERSRRIASRVAGRSVAERRAASSGDPSASAAALSEYEIPARSWTGPSWRSAAIRRRSSADASTARTSSASRSSCVRCSRRPSRQASGTWTSHSRTRLASRRAANGSQIRRPVASTALRRWYVSKSSGVPSGGADRQVDLVEVALALLEPVLGP